MAKKMLLSRYWAIICRLFPTKVYLRWQYWHIYHRRLNINHPKTYAEKLAYLKTHYKNPLLSKLCDKYEVRDYVKNVIGEDYLVPLYGIYNSVESIEWDKIPEAFVLKCTHDSGSVVLHKKNDLLDKDSISSFLSKKMKRNLFWYSREYPYKTIKPRIICEKLLEDKGKIPNDYKILCFNGKPKFVVLDMDRHTNHHRDIYDLEWNKLDCTTDHPQGVGIAPKPKTLEKMIELATKLSVGFDHVRIDFYTIGNKVYFGEMTFFPWGGPIWFEPEKWNYFFGDLIKLQYDSNK